MTLRERAEREARSRYRSLAFRRTFVRGALAADAGRPVESCPYRRRRRGEASWARTWRAIWLAGWGWATDRR